MHIYHIYHIETFPANLSVTEVNIEKPNTFIHLYHFALIRT